MAVPYRLTVGAILMAEGHSCLALASLMPSGLVSKLFSKRLASILLKFTTHRIVSNSGKQGFDKSIKIRLIAHALLRKDNQARDMLGLAVP